MKKIIFNIFNLIEKVIPKTNIIIFNSFPDYSDNSYALFKYMLENNYDKRYKIVWLVTNRNPKILGNEIKNEFNKNIKCYEKNSILGFYFYFRAFKVFCTHGIFSFIKVKNNKKINLWHGMPLKTIGFLDEKYKNKEKVYNQDYLISTSTLFQEIMAEAFKEEKGKVLLTGQPRNDLFFEKSNFFIKRRINKNKYKKIFLWMPTYRQSIIGDIRIDGEIKNNYLGVIPFENIKGINNLLKEKKYLLIIKIHPMDILNKINLEEYSNIIILKTNDLENINEQLYPLLGSTDALITDYSSVWIDYEILDKPIFFAIHDYEEYKNTRGLLFEDFIDISPHPVMENYEEFKKFIENYEEIDINNRKFTDKYNKYKDNKSCERIIRYIGLEKNEK